MKLFKVAIIGGKGLVSTSLIDVLQKEKFPYSEIVLYGSYEEDALINNDLYHIVKLEDQTIEKFDFVFFCTNEEVSQKYASKFIELGAKVIDNSSCFRLDKDIPLVVPEINGMDLLNHNNLYANPNCTTIMILLALKPLIDRYKLEKVYISSYQSVSGAGKEALNELYMEQNNPNYIPKILPNKNSEKSTIFDNILPLVDVLLDCGYTGEEKKIILESKKILHLENIEINPLCVRVPTSIGHGASIFAIFEEKVDLEEVYKLFSEVAYLKVYRSPSYPTLTDIRGSSLVGVGRIRKDMDCDYTLSFFVTSDNLIRGASYNAYKIALKLVEYYK